MTCDSQAHTIVMFSGLCEFSEMDIRQHLPKTLCQLYKKLIYVEPTENSG